MEYEIRVQPYVVPLRIYFAPKNFHLSPKDDEDDEDDDEHSLPFYVKRSTST